MGILRDFKSIEEFCNTHGITFEIKEDNTGIRVDICTNFLVKGLATIGEIPFPLGIVHGDFMADGVGLHSTKNFPLFVGGIFSVADNFLYETENLPECGTNGLNGEISVANNRIKNFIGFPRTIHGDLIVCDNCLNSFEGFPEKIDGRLFLENNWELKNNKTIGLLLSCEIAGSIYMNRGQFNKLDLEMIKKKFNVVETGE